MTGKTLGHYQILEPLGSGGMGEVFKGRDTRLNRFVAVKILKPERLSHASRKQRFIQEAQAASALNHPNIVTIYDIGSQDGMDFMVMEYIPGSTLDARIPRQGMRLGEALRIAVQIAEGLRRAHAAGIVHRDLKPSNIMAGDEGVVKILDFGLAKLTEDTGIAEDEATRSARPETEEGTILGTTAYMSPEQAEGRKLDARTDIFSFGVVLYEMLTGRKAFEGNSRMSTISSILKEEPKPLDNVPPELERILRRCLRKDREKRIQHMDDVKLALEEIREESESGKLSTAAQPVAAAPPARRRWGVVAAGAAAVIAALGAVGWNLRPKPAESQQPAALTRLTSDAGLTTTPAISLDGKLLAYSSDRATNGENLDIWLQHLGGGDPVRLTKGDADESEPDFSPDGSHVAYTSGQDGVWVVPTLGGEPRQIAPKGSRPKYSPDGRWIAYHVVTPSAPASRDQTFVSPAAGGAPRKLVPAFDRAANPVWSPDGKLILFEGVEGARQGWFVTPMEGGAVVDTGLREILAASKDPFSLKTPAIWMGESLILTLDFPDRSQLMRIHLEPSGKATGPLEPVTQGTAKDSHPSISADGRLVFSTTQLRSDLWLLPVAGNSGKVTGEMQRLTDEFALSDTASISVDGTRVLYRSNRDGRYAMWLRDITTGKLRRVSSQEERVRQSATFPSLSADGRIAAYEVMRTGQPPATAMVDLAQSASLSVLERRPWALSPSGRYLLCYNAKREPDGAIHALLIDGGKSSPLLASAPFPQRSPRLSPDERWVAMHVLNTTATRRILIAPFQFGRPAPESEWIYITDGKTLDRNPAWSPDGNLLYWIADRNSSRGIWAVKLDPATKRPAGAPFEVKMFPGVRRSMMPFANTAAVQPAVARDKIVFALGEMTGNIWMTRLPK